MVKSRREAGKIGRKKSPWSKSMKWFFTKPGTNYRNLKEEEYEASKVLNRSNPRKGKRKKRVEDTPEL